MKSLYDDVTEFQNKKASEHAGFSNVASLMCGARRSATPKIPANLDALENFLRRKRAQTYVAISAQAENELKKASPEEKSSARIILKLWILPNKLFWMPSFRK